MPTVTKTCLLPAGPSSEENEEEKLATLRREIAIGLEAAAAGRFSKKSVREIADEVLRKHAGG